MEHDAVLAIFLPKKRPRSNASWRSTQHCIRPGGGPLGQLSLVLALFASALFSLVLYLTVLYLVTPGIPQDRCKRGDMQSQAEQGWAVLRGLPPDAMCVPVSLPVSL